MAPVTTEPAWWALNVTGKLGLVETIHPQSNKFVSGVKIKATCESKHNDSPDYEKKQETNKNNSQEMSTSAVSRA